MEFIFVHALIVVTTPHFKEKIMKRRTLFKLFPAAAFAASIGVKLKADPVKNTKIKRFRTTINDDGGEPLISVSKDGKSITANKSCTLHFNIGPVNPGDSIKFHTSEKSGKKGDYDL